MYPYNQGNPNQLNPNGRPPASNPFLQPQFANQGFLSPQSGMGNRNVYASTIQASTSSSNLKGGFGLSRLQTMGRTIKQDTDALNHHTQEAPTAFSSTQSSNLSFKPNNDKGKLASSVIFQKNYDEDINRFPGFNVAQNNPPPLGTSKLDALLAKKQPVEVQNEQPSNESAQDKRKREITAIKQELEFLNKRMENTVGKKTEGEAKPYFQLPTRKTSTVNPGSVAFLQQEQPKVNVHAPNSEPVADSTGNKAFFTNYAKGPESSTSSTGSTASNGSIGSTGISYNGAGQLNYDPKPQQSPPITLANPAKTEGGMFKKKNPYLSDESAKVADHAPKTFMLSPKGAALNHGFKAEPIKPAQIKVAETVQLSHQPIKGMKKTFQVETTPTPKQFKKSDFAIGKKMGKGQFGEVMLVQHKETGFLCGMKVMSKKQIREEKYVNQIARELSIQFFLNHRNIAPLYGYFQDEENVYLLIEYCTGGQLLQLLRKNHRMEEADTSPIIREICEGLDYIHKEEIIHRDIKPENILFNFNTVKICDFGWAVHCGSGMRKTVSGSPLYYSPEIVKETEYDEKVDIWAVGMMTYECLLGKIPFRIYSELDLNRIVQDQVKFPEYVDVSDDAKSFILGIMQKNPDDRMVMKDIFKHTFIRKYLSERKVANEILQEFRRVLS